MSIVNPRKLLIASTMYLSHTVFPNLHTLHWFNNACRRFAMNTPAICVISLSSCNNSLLLQYSSRFPLFCLPEPPHPSVTSLPFAQCATVRTICNKSRSLPICRITETNYCFNWKRTGFLGINTVVYFSLPSSLTIQVSSYSCTHVLFIIPRTPIV